MKRVTRTVLITLAVLVSIGSLTGAAVAVPIIVDHYDTDLTERTQAQYQLAKDTLHIAYGHTSHGSQITSGMTGMVGFINGGGLGLTGYADDFFDWNNGGGDGALDLHDYAMGGDVGYYPQWVNNTRAYLNNPANVDVNVIMWSWCGQVDEKYAAGTLDNDYLTPMAQLEAEYADVSFVYMTGHVDIWDDANNKAANEIIRAFCEDNDKILYDFADIERYNPDGDFFEFVNDNCNYYDSVGGSLIGNWATEWQNDPKHVEGVDWYDVYAAHSQALNGNQKAYAAWALFADIAEARAVPIPGAAWLMGSVLLGVIGLRRRR